MPLSDLAIRKAKPRAYGYRMTDGAGLFLWVTPAGGKFWRCRYERDGRDQTLSLGAYPDLSLAEARTARDDARRLLRAGTDPAKARKAGRAETERAAADTFEAMARAYHAHASKGWAQDTAAAFLARLVNHVFPAVGDVPVRSVTPQQVLAVVSKAEAEGGPSTARRLRAQMSAVFSYAIALDRAQVDPAAAVKAILPPIAKGRRAARTDLDAVRDVLKRLDDYPCDRETKLGMRLLALTAVRSTVVSAAPWSEFAALDPDEPTWVVPAARMKLILVLKGDERRNHAVPLARQAVETVEALRSMTGHTPWLIPNARTWRKPCSKTRFGSILIQITQGEHVPHGWRSAFSTIMNERFRGDRAVIDFMLAHVPADEVEAAYNRAEYRQRRRELAQAWADMLTEGLRPAREVALMPSRLPLRPQPEHG